MPTSTAFCCRRALCFKWKIAVANTDSGRLLHRVAKRLIAAHRQGAHAAESVGVWSSALRLSGTCFLASLPAMRSVDGGMGWRWAIRWDWWPMRLAPPTNARARGAPPRAGHPQTLRLRNFAADYKIRGRAVTPSGRCGVDCRDPGSRLGIGAALSAVRSALQDQVRHGRQDTDSPQGVRCERAGILPVNWQEQILHGGVGASAFPPALCGLCGHPRHHGALPPSSAIFAPASVAAPPLCWPSCS